MIVRYEQLPDNRRVAMIDNDKGAGIAGPFDTADEACEWLHCLSDTAIVQFEEWMPDGAVGC